MKRKDDEELTLEKLDDYYEIPEKKRVTIALVIVSGIIICSIILALKFSNGFSDYVGTSENPGITPVRTY